MPRELDAAQARQAALEEALAHWLEAPSGERLEQLATQSPELAGELRQFAALHRELLDLVPQDLDDASEPESSNDSDVQLAEYSVDLPATLSLPQSSPEGSVPDSRPRRFGDYELLEEIGQGGMGVVYKARQLSLDRIVALKMIRGGHLATREEIDRLRTEAMAAARVSHAGIVPVYEVGQQHGQHYFTMAYVPGESLNSRLARGALEPVEAARLTRQIASALACAHEQGIVHRDLKPANILLDRRGEPQITDFGLAKLFDQQSSWTMTGQVLGTPAYMPPEQAAGRTGHVSFAADIYALGAILYALLTGRPPFQAPTPLDTLLLVLEGEVSLPRLFDRRIPRELESIAMRCLARDPAARYSSAAELVDDLDRFLAGDPVQARPAGWVQRLRRWFRREPTLAAHLAGLTAVFLLQVALYVAVGGDRSYLAAISGLLAAWGLASWGLQQWMHRDRWAEAARLSWAAVDAALVTTALYLVDPPLGPLLVVYPLLIAGAGLFFRVHLVVLMTVACMISYQVLVWIRPDTGMAGSRSLYFAALLVVMGAVVAYQVRRIRNLSRIFGREP